MNIEQAKCKLRLHRNLTNSDETYNAFDMAIKSFDMWDKVLKDLENLEENMADGVGGSKFTVKFIIKMIKEYMEEIEE